MSEGICCRAGALCKSGQQVSTVVVVDPPNHASGMRTECSLPEHVHTCIKEPQNQVPKQKQKGHFVKWNILSAWYWWRIGLVCSLSSNQVIGSQNKPVGAVPAYWGVSLLRPLPSVSRVAQAGFRLRVAEDDLDILDLLPPGLCGTGLWSRAFRHLSAIPSSDWGFSLTAVLQKNGVSPWSQMTLSSGGSGH